jgi:signal transduction histidine kinase
MKPSLRRHLQRQTLLVIFTTYGLCLAALFISSFWQGFRTQDELLSSLVASSASQRNLILPSFLLPEQHQGLPLLLERLRREETLTSVAIVPDGKPPKEWERSCRQYRDAWVCRRFFPSQVAAMVPLSHDGRFFGSMLKIKDVQSGVLAPEHTSTAVFLALALLLSLIGLVWITTRLTSREIPAAVEELLTNVRKALAGESDTRTEAIRFEEFQRLSEAIQTLIKDMEEGKRATTVANVTQMLAHDVRKPFSLLRIVLGMLQKADNIDRVRAVLSRASPEIDKAMAAVSGLIADVMEAGSKSSSLDVESVAPESLIDNVLRELFRIHPQCQVAVTYDIQHLSNVNVDARKIERAFSNIIGNALQAMSFRGHLWIRTREFKDVIEFCLGNSDSFIPEENLSKLFDPFFTSGKKGGTGLGLAIAHKQVTTHGGEIRCRSERSMTYPNGMVEFSITLPTARPASTAWSGSLLRHSSEVNSPGIFPSEFLQRDSNSSEFDGRC